MDAVEQAVETGNAGEDDSRGDALSNEPMLRAKQLAMRRYALIHDRKLEGVLQVCFRPEHRRAAAEILGYGRKSETQIIDLVRASRDSDGLYLIESPERNRGLSSTTDVALWAKWNTNHSRIIPIVPSHVSTN